MKSMAPSNSNPLFIIFPLAILLISPRSCSADNNTLSGSLCANSPANESTSQWTVNLNNVFNSLAANVNLSDGYNTADAGRGSDRAFGLIQCRGDISPSDCGKCARESFSLAVKQCAASKTGVIWQRWCLLRYSNVSFYGEWGGTGAAILSVNATDSNDPAAAAAGMTMMSRLAADAPNESLMFAKSATEDRRGGERYGLAQCTRDLAKKDCGDCLNFCLTTFGPGVMNNTAWQMNGVGCFMLYNDHQFYFNSSISAAQDNPPRTRPTGRGVGRPNGTNAAANVGLGGWFVVGTAILTTAMACL